MFVQGKEEKEREAKENLGRRELGTYRREEEEERKNIKRREGIKNGKIRERNRKIMKSRIGGIKPDSKARKE